MTDEDFVPINGRQYSTVGSKLIGRAHYLVREAVRKGTLVRPETCERCGAKPRRGPVGHHDHYNKPLDVLWLCLSCHNRRHGEIGRIDD